MVNSFMVLSEQSYLEETGQELTWDRAKEV
jgi:hypothetical protein